MLDQALVFRNVWPTPWIAPAPALSVELGLALLSAAWLARRRGALPATVLRTFALGFVGLTLGRYAMVTAPALYGRPIDLYWDTQHLPNVAAMLAQALPWWVASGAVAAGAILIVALYVGLRWAWGQVGEAVREPRARIAIGALGGLMVSGFSVASLTGTLASTPWFAHPVTPLYAREAAFLIGAWTGRAEAQRLPASPDLRPSLARLDGADVLLVFFESYGAVTHDLPRFAQALHGPRATLDAALRETGHAAVTARVTSPTFGGGSWLAHSSWLTGPEVRDAETYAVLLTTARRSWVTAFAERGYRTLGLMPGLRGDWPEGAFYGFDTIYDARRLDYRGPEFGWWRIPDQYSLARLEAAEGSVPSRRPRFTVFPTITSHIPFRPVAPVQHDWARLLSAEPFDADATAAALAGEAELTDLGPAYVEAIGYTLRFLADYLRQPRDRAQVIILLGDHQPPALVAGEGVPWTVPVHVIARNAALLEALQQAGFQPGLELPAEALGPMHEVSVRVLDAL